MRYCHRFPGGIPHVWVDSHVLLTRPPLPPIAERAFDLHVLGTPPAFILSQDQTRHPCLYPVPSSSDDTLKPCCDVCSQSSYLAERYCCFVHFITKLLRLVMKLVRRLFLNSHPFLREQAKDGLTGTLDTSRWRCIALCVPCAAFHSSIVRVHRHIFCMPSLLHVH